jgi:hypothetical protein
MVTVAGVMDTVAGATVVGAVGIMGAITGAIMVGIMEEAIGADDVRG